MDQILDRLNKMEKELDKIKNDASNMLTRIAIAESDIQNINKKLDKIDSNTTWILRIIIGGILMAALGFVINNGGGL